MRFHVNLKFRFGLSDPKLFSMNPFRRTMLIKMPLFIMYFREVYHAMMHMQCCNCLFLQLRQSTTVEKTIVPQILIQNFNAFIRMVWIL